MASFDPRQGGERAKKTKRVAFAEPPGLLVQDYTPNISQNISTAFGIDKDWIECSGHRDSVQCSSKSCDSDFLSASLRSHPNILKKKELNLPEPIKSLPFSPSRFLNPVTTSQDVDKEKVTKDLNFSLSHPDDSGFEASGYDADGLFTKALLTSTPICKRSRKSLDTPLKADALSPLRPDVLLSDTCISSGLDCETNHSKPNIIPGDSGNETVFKTPLIRRYLNESGPRTPTPFKCETNLPGNDTSKVKQNFSLSTLNEDDADLVSSTLEIKPPTFAGRSKVKSRCDSSRPQKRARKALVLDMELTQPVQNYGENNYLLQASTSQLAIQLPGSRPDQLGFVPFDQPMAKNTIRIRNCSGLVDEGTVVKCRTFGVGRKSFCTSHHGLRQEENRDYTDVSEFDQKWVAIACGRSEDQRAMTVAARRYLKAIKGRNMQSDLSNVVLKKRFNFSSMR